MLKPRVEIESLADDDEDIYLKTKLETYLQRPARLASLTYPEFYRWWRSATPAEQKKAASKAANGQVLISKTKGANDFHDYKIAKSILDTATESLAEILADYESLVQTGEDLVALGRCLKEHNVSPPVIKAIENFYIEKGVEPLLCSMNVTLSQHSVIVGERVMQITDWYEPRIVKGLSSYH